MNLKLSYYFIHQPSIEMNRLKKSITIRYHAEKSTQKYYRFSRQNFIKKAIPNR